MNDKKDTVDTIFTSIAKVMDEVKGIDKAMEIGKGSNSYKGVADKDVKKIIGNAMYNNGLICYPTSIEPLANIERWEEVDQWSKSTPKATKVKQSVFTEVKCGYKIVHVNSAESIDIVGYGHGVDSQDKSAGKATTYALKNALLYLFLVPTGAIDDTDNTHSNDVPTPQQKQAPQPTVKPKIKEMEAAKKALANGKVTVSQLFEKYDLKLEQIAEFNEVITKKQ
jgi:hypothetical protein